MSKELKISNVLDKHLSPIQIDGANVPIELSTDAIRVNEDATFKKDLVVEGDLNAIGKDKGITFNDNVRISNVDEVAGFVRVTALGMSIYTPNYGSSHSDAQLTIHSYPNYDALIKLYNAAILKWTLYNDGDDSDTFKIGSTLGYALNTELSLDSDGNLTAAGDVIAGDDVAVPATGKLSLDGIGGHTYITEASDDVVRITVGGDLILQLSEKGDDGNEVHFGSSCAGFTQLEPTYDASDTLVDFRHSNKQFLTFGAGNITNINLYFPLVSGNFQLLIKQDGTGSRTITNWKVREFDESLADGENAVKFAGGSNPTLTTDANHVDIISFYWDADNEICYGVATLDFQF